MCWTCESILPIREHIVFLRFSLEKPLSDVVCLEMRKNLPDSLSHQVLVDGAPFGLKRENSVADLRAESYAERVNEGMVG